MLLTIFRCNGLQFHIRARPWIFYTYWPRTYHLCLLRLFSGSLPTRFQLQLLLQLASLLHVHPRTFRLQLSSAQGHQNHFGCHMLCQWDLFYLLWLTIMALSCQSRDIVRQSHTADTTLGRHNSVKELFPLCLALCLLDEFCAKELG